MLNGMNTTFLRVVLITCLVAPLAFADSLVDVPELGAQQTPSASVAGSLRLAAYGVGPVPTNTILPPETLEHIAERIRRQRWQLPPDDKTWPMRDGRPVVDTPRADRIWHEVKEGQSAYRIRHMYKWSRRRLQEMNPTVDLAEIEEGDALVVWERQEGRVAKSYGAPHWGRLYNGEPLPHDENYVILYPHRTFGTYYAVSETKRVLDNYFAKYPKAHKLMVGDISFRRGRRMNPHKSHRTGRDIDISYPRKRPPRDYRRFYYVRRRNLHVERTFSLIKDLIDGGYVEYIFMDRWFQRKLRKEALRKGATKEWVEAVFQYPHWSGGDAIVRHASGHRNHFHVRFKCQPTDRRCR